MKVVRYAITSVIVLIIFCVLSVETQAQKTQLTLSDLQDASRFTTIDFNEHGVWDILKQQGVNPIFWSQIIIWDGHNARRIQPKDEKRLSSKHTLYLANEYMGKETTPAPQANREYTQYSQIAAGVKKQHRPFEIAIPPLVVSTKKDKIPQAPPKQLLTLVVPQTGSLEMEKRSSATVKIFKLYSDGSGEEAKPEELASRDLRVVTNKNGVHIKSGTTSGTLQLPIFLRDNPEAKTIIAVKVRSNWEDYKGTAVFAAALLLSFLLIFWTMNQKSSPPRILAVPSNTASETGKPVEINLVNDHPNKTWGYQPNSTSKRE